MCSSEDLRDTNDVAKFAVPPMMTATLAAQASFSPVLVAASCAPAAAAEPKALDGLAVAATPAVDSLAVLVVALLVAVDVAGSGTSDAGVAAAAFARAVASSLTPTVAAVRTPALPKARALGALDSLA